jgi:hypothetical protein
VPVDEHAEPVRVQGYVAALHAGPKIFESRTMRRHA